MQHTSLLEIHQTYKTENNQTGNVDTMLIDYDD